jgi:demethylmenaquinone methyltransferase/2-methoxy-6-polyprenyl-1,4-benzoquinol methylase
MKGETREIRFTLADASHLPFPNETFDLVTISFATRNINVSKKTLLERFREFHRILRRGGRFVNLETSQPPSWLVRRAFHLYVRLTVKRLGSRISGSSAGYAYLAQTIPRFYNAMELADLMRQAQGQYLSHAAWGGCHTQSHKMRSHGEVIGPYRTESSDG